MVAQTSIAPLSPASDVNAERQTLALHAQEISISRRKVAGDTVRVSTITREQPRMIVEELTHERIEVERVPIGRPVETTPSVRVEGDTTIMSVVEEIVVVRRQLILKEEVRIRRVQVSERYQETVMVREQDAVLTRTEAALGRASSSP